MSKFPQKEVYFCWKEFVTPAHEDEPRLLTPWGDPEKYESAYDLLFDTEQEAIKSKLDDAPDENWILCKVTFEPVLKYLKKA